MIDSEYPPLGTLLYEWGRGRYRIYVYADGEGGEYSEVVDESCEESDEE